MPNSPNVSGYIMYRFVEEVMDRIGDRHAKYVDGGGTIMKGFHPFSTFLSTGLSGFSASGRKGAGYNDGTANAAAIIESLHSMGGTYGKGYVEAILDYARENSIAGVTIAFEADFAPFQPCKQKVVKGVPTLQFTNDNDSIANNKLLGSPFAEIDGAQKVITDARNSKGHSIFDFADKIKNLPTGKYKVVDGKIVNYE